MPANQPATTTPPTCSGSTTISRWRSRGRGS